MSERTQARAALGGILALCAAAFWPVVTHGLLSFDDDLYTADPRVAAGLSWSGARWAFTSFHASNWYPLTLLSHMLDASLFGGAAWGPHLENLLLHAACACLVFSLLRRAAGSLWRAAAVAAVFAVHPLQVETVAWLAERKNLLCALLALSCVGAYGAWVARRSAARYAGVAGLFAAALLAKPAAVSLPLALLALDVWPLRRRETWPRLLREKLPLLALAAASCAVTLAAARGQSLVAVPWPARAANAALACAGYLRRLAWPSGLAVFYPHPGGNVSYARAAAAAVVGAAALTAAWRRRARQPWLLAGALWFLAWLLPTLGLVQAGRQALADRYAYLALLGPLAAAAWSVPERRARSLPVAAAASAAFVAMLVCAALQVRYWRDSLTLFRRAVDVADDNALARVNLGDELLLAGRVPEAEEQYRAALAADPASADAAANLGYALVLQGRAAEAEAALDEALRLGGSEPRVALAVQRTRSLLKFNGGGVHLH